MPKKDLSTIKEEAKEGELDKQLEHIPEEKHLVGSCPSEVLREPNSIL